MYIYFTPVQAIYALSAALLLMLFLRRIRSRRQSPAHVNPVPNSVSLHVCSDVSHNYSVSKHVLEGAFLEDGHRVLCLPKDWLNWRKSGEITRPVQATDPALIVELQVDVYQKNKRSPLLWSVAVRIFYPDGRQRNAGHCTERTLGTVVGYILSLANSVDFTVAREILERDTASDVAVD